MTVRLGSEYLGAGRAVHDAFAIQLNSKPWEPMNPSCGTAKNISAALAANGVQAGKVMAVIDTQKPHVKNWLIWAYAPRGSYFELPAQGRFFAWLVDEVDQAIATSGREYREATKSKIRDVVAYTVIDYRHRRLAEKSIHPVSDIKKRCGIQHGNWRRDFSCWHEWAERVCDQLDRVGLCALGPLLQQERDRANPGNEGTQLAGYDHFLKRSSQ